MTKVVALKPTIPVPTDPAPARLESPKVGAKRRVVEHLLSLSLRHGQSDLAAGVVAFRSAFERGALPLDVRQALTVARPTKSNAPDRSTLYRWVEQYRQAEAAGSLAPLAPKHQGRAKSAWGWEARALHLWQDPNKPAAAEVARRLREEGQASATEPRVRRYLASLPSHELDNKRLGKRLKVAVRGNYVSRTTEGLKAGDIYVGDGHTIDVYLQHPSGKRPWRAELTLWMDVRSRCVVGWWLSEAESTLSTLFALSSAVQAADHIPAMVHVDNGSGYAAQVHTDEATGLLTRLGITPMFALPYNAKAKPVERFFKTMEDSFGTRWPSYCGYRHDPEALDGVLKLYKKGQRDLLPSAEQWKEGFVRWLAGYHNEEHPEVRGRSHNEVWAESCERHAPKGEALFWPREERVVSRRSVWIDNRRYTDPALAAWNKTELRPGKVLVEYDIHDDAKVRVLAPDGRWICDAELVQRRGYVTSSRIEDARAKREREALKRLELHAKEVRDRAASLVDAGEQLRQIEDATGEVSALDAELEGTPQLGHDGTEDDAPVIDIWSE